MLALLLDTLVVGGFGAGRRWVLCWTLSSAFGWTFDGVRSPVICGEEEWESFQLSLPKELLLMESWVPACGSCGNRAKVVGLFGRYLSMTAQIDPPLTSDSFLPPSSSSPPFFSQCQHSPAWTWLPQTTSTSLFSLSSSSVFSASISSELNLKAHLFHSFLP